MIRHQAHGTWQPPTWLRPGTFMCLNPSVHTRVHGARACADAVQL